MSTIIKATMTAAFLVACIAGASPSFAANNSQSNASSNNGGKSKSKDNKCANDASGADAGANCTTEPSDQQK